MTDIKQLRTIQVSQAVMLKNLAFFRDLKPQSSYYKTDQGIPAEAYEPARVDGASPWRAYRAVTLPLLRPALLVAAVLNLIYVFNSFPIVWTLNDRNPRFAHHTMITYMYKIAFKSALRDVGLSAALGVVNVLAILLAVLVYLRAVRWREQEA